MQNTLLPRLPSADFLKKYIPIAVAGFLLVAINGCSPDTTEVEPEVKTADKYSSEVAEKWAALTLKLTRTTPGFSPPVASRALGYAGLTLYEAVVPGLPDYKSLAGQLNGLQALPAIEAGQTYNWALSANAAQAEILKNLYPTTSAANKVTLDSLKAALRTDYAVEEAAEVVERSEAFGKAIAAAIFEWSKRDGGHEGYNRNFPTDYVVPVFNGSWKPTENGRVNPMQPYWGKNRTFVIRNSVMPLPQPLAVSTSPTSQYYAQHLELYSKNKALTQEEKEISIWWADDPSETFTPPGHSYNLARIAIKTAKVDLGKAAEALARTGIAVADAFILCWKCKYAFSVERPYTFVRRAIDPNWIPFWPAPPFPAYTSGHASQSGAAATVLAAVFGNNFKFTDDTHVSRIRDTARNTDFKARSFSSFWETAEESAYSRFLGGIHTRQDNDTGLKEGRKIGQNINDLAWTK
ncbi:vanadium-dependent haloperoxidase [Telluribacter sp.]|jgi:hypothetical protein|uniref:vanadium-dependent haloperoxidase n=1 Tax=Telluribacter sp. TaxID=1978767 RepID=UPI002E12143B|nr:phosphoesterase [Telluribacter sp.]